MLTFAMDSSTIYTPHGLERDYFVPSRYVIPEHTEMHLNLKELTETKIDKNVSESSFIADPGCRFI